MKKIQNILFFCCVIGLLFGCEQESQKLTAKVKWEVEIENKLQEKEKKLAEQALAQETKERILQEQETKNKAILTKSEEKEAKAKEKEIGIISTRISYYQNQLADYVKYKIPSAVLIKCDLDKNHLADIHDSLQIGSLSKWSYILTDEDLPYNSSKLIEANFELISKNGEAELVTLECRFDNAIAKDQQKLLEMADILKNKKLALRVVFHGLQQKQGNWSPYKNQEFASPVEKSEDLTVYNSTFFEIRKNTTAIKIPKP